VSGGRVLGASKGMAVVVAAFAAWASNVAPASAKGDGLVPVRDRYEPGETATLVGYSGGPAPTSRFSAGIAKQPDGPVLEIGQLVIQPTGNADASLALRVSITFPVPRDLPPGEYQVGFTDE